MATFTATHGVEFGEQDAKTGLYSVWARFERDRTLDTADGVKGYAFSTDDKKVADRVRAVNDYGIAEVAAPVATAAPPAPPAPAA